MVVEDFDLGLAGGVEVTGVRVAVDGEMRRRGGAASGLQVPVRHASRQEVTGAVGVERLLRTASVDVEGENLQVGAAVVAGLDSQRPIRQRGVMPAEVWRRAGRRLDDCRHDRRI